MTRIESAHILMLAPPPAAPSTPARLLTRFGKQLVVRGLSWTGYDANLDFYARYLFAPEVLSRLYAGIAARENDQAYRTADPETRRFLNDLRKGRSGWEARINAAGDAVAICRSEQFYRPERIFPAIDDLGSLLKLASLAFYPTAIGWGTLNHPRLHESGGLKAFVEDPDANPFLDFYASRLADRFAGPPLRLLLLVIASPAQWPAAATLARCARRADPRLKVAVTGRSDCPDGSGWFADAFLPLADEGLFDKLTRLAGRAGTGRGSPPLASGSGLAPAAVASIDLRKPRPVFDAHLELPACLADARSTRGVRRVIVATDNEMLAKFAGQVPVGEPPPCIWGLATELAETCRKIDGAGLYGAGVRLIIWQTPAGRPETLKAVLWQMSRAGIWNHLALAADGTDDADQALSRFAAANPNIVHSWGRTAYRGAPLDALPVENRVEVYREVQALPGKPFWQTLKDPVHLLLYLERHGREKVMRWRTAASPGVVRTLGSELSYHYRKPAQLPPGYLDEICAMVAAGGSVDMQRVRYNLERAFLIAYAVENGVIIGNSSLKNPRSEYIKTVNQQSGLDLTHYVERGYTSVRPEYRGMGIGAKLLEGLTQRAAGRKVFAVISADNEAARKMALRNRTRQVATYFSPRLGKEVGIWIPEWMLD